MSFILDALKKVDEKKRFGGEAAAGEFARSTAARKRRGRELLLVGGVAIASAALTAGVLVFFSMRPEAASTAPAAERPRPATATSAPAPPRSVAPRAPAPVPAAALPGPTASATPAPTTTTATTTTTPQPEPEPEPEADDVEPQAPAPAVRIVGRPEPEPAPSAPEPPASSSSPAALPELELQGTSVLDGRPVAVISDRRVFEGDFIEGARVLRIEERSVTLELDGQRFTLTF